MTAQHELKVELVLNVVQAIGAAHSTVSFRLSPSIAPRLPLPPSLAVWCSPSECPKLTVLFSLCAHSQAAPPLVEALRGALLRLEASALDTLTRSLFSKADAARHFGHSADRSLPPASSSAAPTLQSLRAEIDAAVGASAAALSAASGGGSTDASGGSGVGSGVGVRFGSSVLPFPNANFVFFTSKAAAAHLASDWTADDVLADRSAAPQPQPPRKCRCGSAAVRL